MNLKQERHPGRRRRHGRTLLASLVLASSGLSACADNHGEDSAELQAILHDDDLTQIMASMLTEPPPQPGTGTADAGAPATGGGGTAGAVDGGSPSQGTGGVSGTAGMGGSGGPIGTGGTGMGGSGGPIGTGGDWHGRAGRAGRGGRGAGWAGPDRRAPDGRG
jgi:hypothetical protein